jgi:hypothetical protein
VAARVEATRAGSPLTVKDHAFRLGGPVRTALWRRPQRGLRRRRALTLKRAIRQLSPTARAEMGWSRLSGSNRRPSHYEEA